MFKRFTNLALLTMLSAAAFAQTTPPPATGAGNAPAGQNGQRRGGRGQMPYTVVITNDSKKVKLDTTQTAALTAAFKAAYPAFVAVDGTRGKREITMNINDTLKSDITAKIGEISVNGKWLNKKKNFENFGPALTAALRSNWHSVDTVKKDDYQLVFINKNSDFNPEVRKNLIDTYFEVYPKLVSTFNDKVTHNVIFITDTAYAGVAECSGNRILFSTKYMNKNPFDIDIVTHEGFHIVQAYGGGAGPSWLTEGIADFIRYKYGVDNVGSKWALPNPKFDGPRPQKYTDSYRVTARFFEWIDQKVKPGMMIQMDKELRNHTYTAATWAQLSGKTVDELWDAYTKEPEITLKYSSKAAKN